MGREGGVQVSDIKVGDDVTTESPFLSAAPDPMIRLEVLKLVLSYGCEGLTPEAVIEAGERFAAWVEGR